jgi:hypothetical protein
MLAFIENYDALLSPVAPYVAPFHGTTFDDDKLRGAGYMQMHNLTGWPSATVRVGTSPEGLPINVQVAARPWREDVALAMDALSRGSLRRVEDAANLISSRQIISMPPREGAFAQLVRIPRCRDCDACVSLASQAARAKLPRAGVWTGAHVESASRVLRRSALLRYPPVRIWNSPGLYNSAH